MKEYLRSDGDTLAIPYKSSINAESIVFNVYDIDLEEYLQSDESNAKTANVTAASGSGTTITYTASNNFSVGSVVTITGLTTTTGSSLNKSNVVVASRTASQFTVANTTVGTAVATQSGKALEITSDFNLILNQEVTAYDRRLKIEIQAISSNTYVEDEMYANVVRPYATPEEIAEYAGLTIVSASPSSGEITRAELTKLEKKARLYINAKVGDEFKFSYKTVGTLGQGTDVLHLGQRVESFNQIIKDDEIVWDTTSDPEIDILEYDVAIQRGKTSLKVVAIAENINEWTDVSVLKSYGFFEKNSSYAVRGEYGWKYIPVDINQATCELVNDMLCSDFSYRTKGVKSIKNDAYSVEFKDAPINEIVDALISGYKRFDMWAV
jgi:hypothetical protein